MSKLSERWHRLVERRFVRGSQPTQLNAWQQAFCEWRAEQLNIPLNDSIERFNHSWAALNGGHARWQFKIYCELYHDLLRPFIGNRPGEIQQAYAAHAQLHFLRMLSYRVPVWPNHIPELAPLLALPAPTIVDFGCGLAQTSISLALYLREQARSPELFLADIPVPQLEFLRWFCRRLKLSTTVAECTPATPLPPLPPCNLLIATELFEHLHQPLPFLSAFADSIRPGGFLLTNIADHTPEFLHVTPDLAPLRAFLRERGWRELRPNRIFQKV
jgi:SAM-dependent methyltransferase